MYRKDVANQGFGFALTSKATGDKLTGATVTVRYSIEGGVQATGLGTVTERGNGQYWYAMPQAETNGIQTSFIMEASGAFPVEKTVSFVSFDPTQTYLKSAIYEDNVQNTPVYFVSKLGDNNNDGKNWSTAKLTIQAATTLAPEGSRIKIGPGNFNEQIATGNKSLEYIGAGKALTIIQPTADSGSHIVLDFGTSTRGYVENLSIKTALHVTGCINIGIGIIEAGNLTIKNCFLRNTISAGQCVRTEGQLSYFSYYDSTFEAPSGTPILVEDSYEFYAENCRFYGGTIGAALAAYNKLTAINCRFHGPICCYIAGGSVSINAGVFLFDNCFFLGGTGISVRTDHADAQTLINNCHFKCTTYDIYCIGDGDLEAISNGMVRYTPSCEIDTAKIFIQVLSTVTVELTQPNTDGSIVTAITPNIYDAEINYTIDETNAKDEYSITWRKNGILVTSGITTPLIQVVNRATGEDHIASTAMTQIGTTGSYKFDAITSSRLTAGEAYRAIISATIDGATRTDSRLVARDSAV